MNDFIIWKDIFPRKIVCPIPGGTFKIKLPLGLLFPPSVSLCIKKKGKKSRSFDFGLAVSLGRGREREDVSMQSSYNLAVSASITDPPQPFQEQIPFCKALRSITCLSDKHITKTGNPNIKISEWCLKPEKEALNESGIFPRTL